MIRVSRVPIVLGLVSLAALPALGDSRLDALLEQVLWLEEQAGLVKSIEVEFTHTQRMHSANGQGPDYSKSLPADPVKIEPRGQLRIAPADNVARRRQLDIEQQLLDRLREQQLAQQQQQQQLQQQLQQQEQLKRQQQVVEQSQVAAQAKRKEWGRIPAAKTDQRQQAEAEYNELAQTLARELATLQLLEQQAAPQRVPAAAEAVRIMPAPGGQVVIRGQAPAGGQLIVRGNVQIPVFRAPGRHDAPSQNYRATWHRQGNKVRCQWTTIDIQPERTTTWAFDGRVMMTFSPAGAKPRVNLSHPDPSLFVGRTQPYEFAFELNGFPLAQLIRLAPWREVSQGDYQGQPRLDVLLDHPTNPLRRVLLSFDGEHRLTSREIYVREGEGFRLDERHEFAGYEPHDSGTDTPIWYPTQITMHHYPSVFANSAEITKATIKIQRVVFNEELPEERFAIDVPEETGIYDARTRQWVRFPKRAEAAQAPVAPLPPVGAGNKPPGIPPNLQVVPVPKGEELAPVEPVPSTVRDLVWRPKPGERVERLLPLRPVDDWTGRR